MRTCPNGRCRACHPDEVGQCPDCGAPMSRTPDAVVDPDAHLDRLRMQALSQSSLDKRVFGRGEVNETNHNPDVFDTARECALFFAEAVQ